MDHYADDLAALIEHLVLKKAVYGDFSTGSGEIAHYKARHGETRVAKAAILSDVPPLMAKSPTGELPKASSGNRRPTDRHSTSISPRGRSMGSIGPTGSRRNP